jgi:hypothetical protein
MYITKKSVKDAWTLRRRRVEKRASKAESQFGVTSFAILSTDVATFGESEEW